MQARSYDAILLDLDGTLLDGRSRIRPKNLAALHAARDSGVRVMVATGRSKVATLPILAELQLDSRAVVFNGAAVYCPVRECLLEERTLSNRTRARVLAFGEHKDHLTIIMQGHRKLALEPRTEVERRSLEGLHGLEFVPRDALAVDNVIRITFLSGEYEHSAQYAREVEEFVRQPMYLTHFPLSMLPMHRESQMHAVDVHPPCRGKGEALRVLEETYGIPQERVVAVGDATNDVPMLERAGLAVAMENSMEEVVRIADRVIGHHDTDAIAELVEELLL